MADPSRTRRPSVALALPAVIAAALALVALWRIGAPTNGERGAVGTMGTGDSRPATFEQVRLRQLTSGRTFWADEPGRDRLFVVSDVPVQFVAGTELTISGRVEPAPDVEIARRAWEVDEATARAVREQGIYVRALRITRVR